MDEFQKKMVSRDTICAWLRGYGYDNYQQEAIYNRYFAELEPDERLAMKVKIANRIRTTAVIAEYEEQQYAVVAPQPRTKKRSNKRFKPTHKNKHR